MARRQDERKHQEWRERFTRYQTSGLTVAAFCAQERVSVNTFYYWARRVDSVATSPTRPSVRPANSPAVVATSDRTRSSSRTSSELATSSTRGSEVRFHFDTAVEVSVPRVADAAASGSDFLVREKRRYA